MEEVSFSGGNRKRKRDRDLQRLLQEPIVDSKHQIREKRELQISFQNGEDSFIVGEASDCYTHGKCDFDEQLIGSPDFWHQIIVSPD